MKLVLLCVVFVQGNLTLLMAEEDRRPSATQRSSGEPDVWNPEKPRTIFARRGLTEFQRSQAMRPFGDRALKAPRCSRVKENCDSDSHSRCCDPCSSCHCCFFNTICRCWRLGHQCQRKT